MAEIKKFMVVDLSSVHTIHVTFCGCRDSPEHHIQLLCQGWFPALTISPKTAFTFDVLNTFHLLNLQSKTALYDFLLAIHHKSDNLDIKQTKVTFITIYCASVLTVLVRIAMINSSLQHESGITSN